MKSIAVQITLLIFLTYSLSNADDLVRIPVPNQDIVVSVSQSAVRHNLTNYRDGNFIQLTLMLVFLTREMSQRYKKGTFCPLPANSNDYKYVLQDIRFRFWHPQGWIMGEYGYDKYDNLICGGSKLQDVQIYGPDLKPIITKLKELFEEADQKDKLEPW